jgi:diguanylate cyclase (GGDEF)-like protein
VLPQTNLSAAQRLAERMRRKVEARGFSFCSNTINATISVGVAEADPNIDSIFDLIKVADRALYVAKEADRNRVCALNGEIGER